MADRELSIILSLQNKATAELDKFGSKIDDLQPTFQKMAAVGTVAFGAITAIAVSTFNAFSDAQAQTEITNQSLSNTLDQMSKGSLAKLQKSLGGTQSAFAGVANAAIDAGKAAVQLGFDDETAANSFSKLFAITKSVTESQNELSIAMDLARYKGISLEDATQKLVLVHAGATKELKALGIAVTDGATVMQNLDSIQKQVSGSAETFGDTAAGAMARIKVQTDNLKESIGGALEPAFSKLLTAVSPLIEKFGEWADQNPDLLAKIILVAGGVAALVAGLGFLGIALGAVTTFAAAFGLTLGALLVPVGLIIAIIGALYFAITQIIGIVNILSSSWDLIWLGMQTTVTERLTAIKTFITTIINAISSVWMAVWNGIKDFFTGVWSSITSTAQSAIQSITNFLQPIINMIDNVISKLNSIGSSVGKGIGSAVSSVGRVLGINDGIVQNGQIITTHPDDYIIATKTPGSLLGAGNGGVVINVYGDVSGQDLIDKVSDALALNIKRQIRL